MIVLGIETSCDETAASVCVDGKIVSSIINSQEIHAEFGGVVPELASREHEYLLNTIVNKSMEKADLNHHDLDGIAVTQGPGLTGTLLTGICFAKGLSQGLSIPIIAINHLEAHIFANFIADPELEFPFICLLVSGGHTQLWLIERIDKYKLLGETLDDAAGEAFDKGARILKLGYPGGPYIEKSAETGDPNVIKFPRGLIKSDSFDFSFSGLKTALLYYMDDYDNNENSITPHDIAASYQEAIIDVLSKKLSRAVSQYNVNTCVIAGGVAANKHLRKRIQTLLSNKKVIFPELDLCTDNAAMVAYLGELKLKNGEQSAIDFGVLPNLKMITF
ncbi:MAG: tRNA (adenosine(37)-N6)-threonylcarbamoyltransferase complex transferase subunit TsaD [Candidatus Marinimicrobia bacterium]|nr:tRNA (adenosine(37)-N6)-threonylcarbamoyltransferase complex transferase subunit TsaD [Candidatus Neomarinimicrobiota bacterium]